MRWVSGATGRYGLTVVTIAIFVIFLGFALFKLTGVERQMRIEASENMLWVLSQSQRELLHFDTTVWRYNAGAVSRDELGLRYDLLLSRLNLLRDPPQSRKLATLGVHDAFMDLSADVFALDPILDTFAPGDTQTASRIADSLDPLTALLMQSASAAMFAEWDELGERLDETRNATLQTIASVLVIMIVGVLLSVRLVLTLRRSQRAETMLRSEKQFSELVVRSSEEGILAIDMESRCTLWNAAMERMFPVPALAALGAELPSISGIFAIECVQRAIHASLAGELHDCTDQPFFSEDRDEPRYLDFLCSPLRSGEQVIGALIFVRDVTERHARARALVRDRDELEKLVGERTADLGQAQDQLLAAMQDLERALESERTAAEFYRGFASTVSHQFRTPLAIIDSSAQRLIRRGDKVKPDEVAERATRIRSSVRRITRFVEATLDAARLDTGQIEVMVRRCNMTELAFAACQRQRDLVPGREISLVDASAEDIPVLCDPTLVEHILSNLLSNAVKYSAPDSAVEMRVGVRSDTVWCAVSDRGVGIPQDELPRLFERFFRASTSAGVAGTGIGLNLSRELARLQSGDISVKTQPGTGSSFTLTLPGVDGLTRKTTHTRAMAQAIS